MSPKKEKIKDVTDTVKSPFSDESFDKTQAAPIIEMKGKGVPIDLVDEAPDTEGGDPPPEARPVDGPDFWSFFRKHSPGCPARQSPVGSPECALRPSGIPCVTEACPFMYWFEASKNLF